MEKDINTSAASTGGTIPDNSYNIPETPQATQPVPTTERTEMQELQETVKKLAADNELLKSIADKKALAQYYQRNTGKIPLRVKLRMLHDKVVIGWRTTEDTVEYDAVSRHAIERQTIEVIYEDGTKDSMTLVEFNRHYEYVECEQIGTIDEEGHLILKLKRVDTGQEYKVGIQFVN